MSRYKSWTRDFPTDLISGWPQESNCGLPEELRRIGEAVEFNRNQYLFLGIVILLLGLQVRVVKAYVLNQDTTRFLAEQTQNSTAENAVLNLASDTGMMPNKVIHPPEWLGWCLISVGSVLILHSLAMPKPG